MKTPRAILLACLLLSLACALTALAGVALAVIGQRWYMLAFECVVIVAASCGVAVGIGRIRSGPALAMLCTGAVVAAAAVLTEPALTARIIQGGGGGAQPVAGVSLVPWIVMRILAGVALIALAAITVLLRSPSRTLPLLFKGIALGIPVAAAMGAVALPGARAALRSMPQLALILASIVAFFVLGALVCASGHCLIRAFEEGVKAADDPPAPGSDPAPAPGSA